MRVRLRGHHPLRPGIQPGSPHTRFSILAAGASAPARPLPRHRYRNPRRVSHGTGLAIIRFRSPLLTEYPFLQVLRCFTSLRTPRTKPCGAGPQQPAGYPIRTPSDQSPVGGSPRPIAAPHVLHRYCLPRHPPYAHGNKPTNPRKKRGATGPCHLHWNTLRQLIRSSKHHPHQQCGRLTKTLANTIQHPQPNRRGRNGSTKSTVRTHPAHPTGHTVHARVHSPVLKPPHHTTPDTHPTRGTARTAGTEHHPRQGAWRSGNPTACTTPPPDARRHPP